MKSFLLGGHFQRINTDNPKYYIEYRKMSTVNKELLPSNLRSQLIEELIKSLNVPIQPEIDQIWAEEAEKRVQAIQSGKITLIDGEEVINQMRKRIEK